MIILYSLNTQNLIRIVSLPAEGHDSHRPPQQMIINHQDAANSTERGVKHNNQSINAFKFCK